MKPFVAAGENAAGIAEISRRNTDVFAPRQMVELAICEGTRNTQHLSNGHVHVQEDRMVD